MWWGCCGKRRVMKTSRAISRGLTPLCCGLMTGIAVLLVAEFHPDSEWRMHLDLCEENNTEWAPTHGEGFLFVGVMTAAKYMESRVPGVWETWAGDVPGAVHFFTSANAEISGHLLQLPIIRLEGVDDSYPPQKKSFAMLRFLYDNYLDRFDWFMRADDGTNARAYVKDLFIQPSRMENFLRSLDPNKPYMLGQAGLGNSIEYGQLALGENENYCMGGPGVIFSREALRQLGPHLEECLGELLTGHEDVELGRCVRKVIGISCPWSFEMQTLFYSNKSTSYSPASQVKSHQMSSEKLLGSSTPTQFITFHPVKVSPVMKALHADSLSKRLSELRDSKHAVLEVISAEAVRETTIVNPLLHTSINMSEQIPIWDFLQGDRIIYCAREQNCPRHTLDQASRTAVEDVISKLFDGFNRVARRKGRLLKFRKLHYAYRRISPHRGIDYVLDMSLWSRRFKGSQRSTMPARKHAYVSQSFGPLLAESPVKNKNPGGIDAAPIYILLALKGQHEAFERLASHLLAKVLPFYNQHLELVLALYRNSSEQNDDVMDGILSRLSQHMPVRTILVDDHGPFNRALAISQAIKHLETSSLLFITDVDILFSPRALQRLRFNTMLGEQVYFPIVFSEYAPEYSGGDDVVPIHDNEKGYFRHFGYGVLSIYREDFLSVGGFNTTFQGWGMEDVDFFERVLRRLRVFRAPEPEMIHVFHQVRCEQTVITDVQREMCKGTRLHSLASLEYLYDRALSIMPKYSKVYHKA